MTQDIKKDTILQNIVKRLIRNGCTPVRSGAHSISLRGALTQGRFLCALFRRVAVVLVMLVMGANTAWGIDDGIYYISHADNGTWYLWPAETTNSGSGYRYVTTFNGTSAPATSVYDSRDNSYCHWILKNRAEAEGGGFQLINVRLGTYIVKRDKSDGDRDVWLMENPTGTDLTRSFFYLYKDDTGPYRISYNKNTNKTFNSATGNKAVLTASTNNIAVANNDIRNGLIQFYADNPKWTFVSAKLEAPTIHLDCDNDKFTIDNYNRDKIASSINIKLIYTTNGYDPTINSDGTLPTGVSEYIPGTTGEVSLGHGDIVKAAVAVPDYGFVLTEVAQEVCQNTYNISTVADLAGIASHPWDIFILQNNLNLSSFDTDISDFKGVFDGQMYTISGLKQALFNTVNGGTIKNVILDNVTIDENENGNAGAICNEATGNARIFNCGVLSGTVSGTNAGGIVGKIDGSTHVVNCYSFAEVSGGDWGAGIVGYNSYSSTIGDLKTMVMNCMFYGDITDGTHKSPIYGGLKITNDGNLNGYNYYLFDDEAPYSQKASNNGGVTEYNCALAAEKKYLTRFEFFRNVLNSNRELAAWYATGDPNKGKGVGVACEMAKWVLDTNVKPYPILKTQGYYPSFINYEDAPNLGSISLTISESNTTSGGQTKPTGASINSNYPNTLTVYDKDLTHNHFNYRTVRLPYYNEVGTGNCTKNKVVTGWKITGFSGGTQGNFVKDVLNYSGTSHGEDEYPPYNFADRSSYAKDLYIAESGDYSGRIFSQGAYFDVPENVTGITIEPYWGTAVYLSDPSYDVAYPKGYGQNNAVFVSLMGARGGTVSINGDEQTVYTDFSSALNKVSSSGTVYDNAMVLVGNYHHYWAQTSPSNSKSFTIMSADLNNDCEPDYSFIVQHGTNRQVISPIRFDFINSPGLGIVQKVETDNAVPSHGIWHPKGWFEVTNTSLIQFSQFEYEDGTTSGHSKAAKSPLILLGGIYDQFVTSKGGVANKTEYIHLGSNVWMKEFCNGTHTASGNGITTRHIPISVTGGEFDSFYLTGTFQPNVTSVTDDAECYISGGKFGEMAGAGQEQLKGDVTWLIDHADITNFYGGGINDKKEVTGNIYVEINNSNVRTYCGGPKFGNMHTDKTVTTKANNSTFTDFYGAGYGGTSYFKDMVRDRTGENSWDSWVNTYYKRDYDSNKGIATTYEYEYIPYSGGQSGQALYVGRLYIMYASLSLAQTKNVESNLEGCTITGSFYGGGKLGRVDGNVTSTLKDCTVEGNAFGAGYSASVEKVKVLPLNSYMNPQPNYNVSVGVFTTGTVPEGVEYTWTYGDPATAAFGDGNIIYTTVNLNTLGQVNGKVTLNIEGNTLVKGNVTENNVTIQSGGVYGGGDASDVLGDTEVTINTPTRKSGVTYNVYNVFGGGNKAEVDGDSKVNIYDGIINNNVFGGGNEAAVTGSTEVNIENEPSGD